MNKRALAILCAALLLPSLASAAPVKRYKMKGTAKEVTLSLKGTQSTDNWMTPVSITERGSTVTINFRLFSGKSTTSVLKKTKGGWIANIAPFEVPTPTDSDFYYCEMSGSIGLKLSRKAGAYVRYFEMACENDLGTTKAYDVLTIKLRK